MDYIENNLACQILDDVITNYEEYQNVSEKGLVIFLDSKWGKGKTTFLKEQYPDGLKYRFNEINSDLIYYDAWEFDDWGSPLDPIIYELSKHKALDDKILKYLNAISNVGYKQAMDLLKIILIELAKSKGLISDEMINKLKSLFGEVMEDTEKQEKLKISSDFSEYKGTKENLKSVLEDRGKVKGERTIFIIDELDRCRPSFAIETLEVLKHVLDIDNMVFIIALDFIQLKQSIKSVYGEIDSDLYLSKFYDIKIALPEISVQRYINLYHNTIIEACGIRFEDYVLKYNLSFRELDKVANTYKRFNHMYYNDVLLKDFITHYESAVPFILDLIIIRQIDIAEYYKIINGEFSKTDPSDRKYSFTSRSKNLKYEKKLIGEHWNHYINNFSDNRANIIVKETMQEMKTAINKVGFVVQYPPITMKETIEKVMKSIRI